MSDLISREALIERYAKEYAKNLIVYGVNIEEKLETATQLSYALNQAYMRGRQDELDNIARRKVSQWIPCSERLPEHQNEVLITLWGDSIYIGWFDLNDKQWCTEEFECENGEVIAWMPLPPIYKGE